MGLVKRVLAIVIAGLLGMVILGLALADPSAAARSRAWLLLGVTVLTAGYFVTRRLVPARSISRQVADPWQGQSRGTATTLLVTGAIALIVGFIYDATNPPNHYSLLFFATATTCLGVGIHRNLKVVRAYFGAGLGSVLNVLQFALPLIAYALDYAGDLQTDQGTRWLLRGLGVIPILFLYLVMWVPLSRVTPAAPVLDETTIGKLG